MGRFDVKLILTVLILFPAGMLVGLGLALIVMSAFRVVL